jgi:Xaa-Pro aminopeptidase
MLPFTKAELTAEISEKMQRLSSLMRDKGYAGVLLTRVSNFAWITGGVGDNQIGWGSEIGAASILVLCDGRKFVIAAHSEIPRLMSEGLAELGYEAVELKWFENDSQFFKRLKLDAPVASDVARDGFATVDIAPLRYQLTETEVKKFRWIGRQATAAVIEVAKQVKPGMMEREMETLASDVLMRRGLRPTVLLMGSDERLFKFRHALPSDTKAVEKYAMVNICAKKWGLVISVTRLVHFGPLSEELRKRYAAVATVNARYFASLKPGTRADQILENAKGWYAELGYPGEWEFHHQGGPCGYGERDYLLAEDSTQSVVDRQEFALNPTVQGAKAEDTVIVFKDHVENITETSDWPAIPVKVNGVIYNSPDVLIIGAPQTVWNLGAVGAAR